MFKVLCFLLMALSVGAVPKGSLTGASQVIIPEDGVDYAALQLQTNVLGSLSRDAEIITPADAPDYGLTSYTNQPYMLFFLGDYVIIKGEIIPLTAYSFPDMVVTEPTTNYPVSFAAFAPNVTNRTPYVGSPEIAEWTRQNDPGDTMALTGENLEAGAIGAFVYAPDSSTVCEIKAIDDRQVAITLPDSLPAGEFYLLWMLNKYGASEPVGINKTELWWIGFDQIVAGEEFSIFGQNLDMGDGLCQLYIEETDTWLTNNASNPYKVEFTLPAGMTNGVYTVSAHNGHGGKYGWSEPQTITVWSGLQFDDDTNTWFNVVTYGADPSGATDSYVGINAALVAARASSMGTVYFPAGTYTSTNYHRILSVTDGLRIKGDGMSNTVFNAGADLGGYAMLGIERSNIEIRDIEIGTGEYAMDSAVRVSGANDVSFYNCRLSSLNAELHDQGEQILNVLTCERVLFKECEFMVSFSMWTSQVRGIIYDGCDFYGVYDCNSMAGGSATRLAFTDCTAQHYDSSDSSEPRGWGKGRFVGGSQYGANEWYIGNNVTADYIPRVATPRTPTSPTNITYSASTNIYHFDTIPSNWFGDILVITAATTDTVGAQYYITDIDFTNNTVSCWSAVNPTPSDLTSFVGPRDSVDMNSGEQIMFEGGATEYRGSPSGVTANSLTFTNLSSHFGSENTYNVFHVMVIEGRGFGQIRKLATFDLSAEKVTLDKPWRVEPDAGSVVVIGRIGYRWAAYNNTLDAVYRDESATSTASSGFQVSGSAHTFIADGNHISDTRTGISNYPQSHNEFDGAFNTISPQYFGLYKNNTITNVVKGVMNQISMSETSWPDPWADIAYAGNVWRKNTFTTLREIAIFGYGEDTGSPHFGLTIYHDNQFADINGDSVTLEKTTGGQILIDNIFDGPGTGTGITFEVASSPSTLLFGNTWTNFTANYGGADAGAILSLPLYTATTNQSAQTFSVYNAGTSNLIATANGQTITNAPESSGTINFTSTVATNYQVIANGQTNTFYVQSGFETLALISLLIDGPTNVSAGATYAYTATGTYSNDDAVEYTASAVWAENNTNTTILNGSLIVGAMTDTQSVDVVASYGGLTNTLAVVLTGTPVTPPTSDFVSTWAIPSDGLLTVPTTSTGYDGTLAIDGLSDIAFADADMTGLTDIDVSSLGAVGDMITMTISGTFPRIYFNRGGDKSQIRTVENLGDVGWTSFESAFNGCNLLTKLHAGTCDTSAVDNWYAACNDAALLADVDLTTADMSAVTTLDYAFRNTSITSIDISDWDLTNCQVYDRWFEGTDLITSGTGSYDDMLIYLAAEHLAGRLSSGEACRVNSYYSTAAASAHSYLDTTASWTFFDLGAE